MKCCQLEHTRRKCLFGLCVGNGIINADGELWRIQRKAGLRFFNNANLKTFINDVLPPVLEDTKHDLDKDADTDVVIDLQEILLELTTRLMGKMAYDVSGMLHGQALKTIKS